jgi:hypothetical protein
MHDRRTKAPWLYLRTTLTAPTSIFPRVFLAGGGRATAEMEAKECVMCRSPILALHKK